MPENTDKNRQIEQGDSRLETGSRANLSHQESSRWGEFAQQIRGLAAHGQAIGFPDVARKLRMIADGETEANYGALLKARRERAGLGQEEAAQLAGVSLQTYRNAERGYREPSAKTRAAIDAVPQLRLAAAASEPQWWHSQKFDPLGLLRGLRSTLARSEGYLDPAHLYLDPAGADQYAQITHEQSYQIATRQPCPIDSAAETVRPRLGKRYDCVLLGTGDGALESRFLRMLPPPGAVIAVDISQALLSAAYTRLVDDLPSSKVFALQGDIANMREHRQLTYRGNVTALVGMFGKTFTNLPDEFDFLDAMGAFQAGTILVLDLNLARGNTEAEIRKKDEALKRGVPPSYHDFLAGPIARYLPGYRSSVLSYSLTMMKMPAGAYSIDCWADVSLFDGTKRRYRVVQFKRYRLDTLIGMFAQHGWKHLATHGYRGQEEKAALLVFVRQ